MLNSKILFTKRHNKRLYRYHQWKKYYGQAIDSDIKRHEEIRKLKTGQSEDTLVDMY